MMFSLGTRTSVKRMCMWPCGASSLPKTVMGRSTSMPGVSMGTRICECCRWRGAVLLVFTITIRMRQRGSPAPEIQCFSPLITQVSPSSTAEVLMFVASEEATSGSVIT